jgi:hypothetical protein
MRERQQKLEDGLNLAHQIVVDERAVTVVELVDTAVFKTVALKACRFDSDRGHTMHTAIAGVSRVVAFHGTGNTWYELRTKTMNAQLKTHFCISRRTLTALRFEDAVEIWKRYLLGESEIHIAQAFGVDGDRIRQVLDERLHGGSRQAALGGGKRSR